MLSLTHFPKKSKCFSHIFYGSLQCFYMFISVYLCKYLCISFAIPFKLMHSCAFVPFCGLHKLPDITKPLSLSWQGLICICDEACGALFVFNSPGWRESARGEERMPQAYFQYVKAFVTKHMVHYSSDWYYLPGKNGHTIGITIRDTMKHTITRPQPAFR